MFLEPLFHSLSRTNCGLVILEHTPGKKKSIVQSPVCMFPYKLKPFFQMINVFFHATQLQVPIPWVLFPLCALTLSIKHICELYCWFLRFDFTKHLGDFSDHISIYISFHVLIGRWTVLNSILIVSAVSLDVFFSCCWPINWPRVRSIFSHDHRVCCLTNEKLSMHHLGLNNLTSWNILFTGVIIQWRALTYLLSFLTGHCIRGHHKAGVFNLSCSKIFRSQVRELQIGF